MKIFCDTKCSNYISEKNTDKIIIGCHEELSSIIDVVVENCKARCLIIHKEDKNKYSLTIRNSEFKVLMLYNLRRIRMDDWNRPFDKILLGGVNVRIIMDNKFAETKELIIDGEDLPISGILESPTLQRFVYYDSNLDYLLTIRCPELRRIDQKGDRRAIGYGVIIDPCCARLGSNNKIKYDALLKNTCYPNLKSLLCCSFDTDVLDMDLYPNLSYLNLYRGIDELKNPRKIYRIDIINPDDSDIAHILGILPECDKLEIHIYRGEMISIEGCPSLDTYSKAGKITIIVHSVPYETIKFHEYKPVCKNFILRYEYYRSSRTIDLYELAERDNLPERNFGMRQKSARK
jgi:hypothetical protein